jgi:hypothetical protein
MYQLVDFANNNFGKEKSRIVNYYYMITQNNNNLEDSVNNLMEIYYLVKKW